MEVILRQDVEKVGLRGEVVDVAPGFARNYLLPRKLAERATPAKVAELRKMEEKRARRAARAGLPPVRLPGVVLSSTGVPVGRRRRRRVGRRRTGAAPPHEHAQ